MHSSCCLASLKLSRLYAALKDGVVRRGCNVCHLNVICCHPCVLQTTAFMVRTDQAQCCYRTAPNCTLTPHPPCRCHVTVSALHISLHITTFRSGCAESATCTDGCSVLQIILHTGDMRWQPRLAEHPALKACKVEVLYMDTTYCLPKHVFPSQVCPRSSAAGSQRPSVTRHSMHALPVWLALQQSS